MRRFFLPLVLLLLTAAPAFALNDVVNGTLQDAASATGNGTAIFVRPYASLGVQVVLTDATVLFEATVDGSNWAAVLCSLSTDASTSSTASASGLYQCQVAGYNQFRARVSVYGSGTVTVKALATTARLGSGSGGGGSPEADTLDTVFDRGKSIDGANSLANAVRIGDGATPWCIYTDASLGPQIRPCTDANVKTLIPTNFTWALRDEEGASDIETVDPDAASAQAIWTYASAYRPLKSIYFPAGSMSVDGTQCTSPTERTINSGAPRYTIICADHDSSSIYFEVQMPDSWDGGTVTLMGSFVQTAADTNNMNADVSMSCRPDNATINNTWGTEIAMDTAMTGSNAIDTVTTAAITPNGTCTGAGTLLQGRWQLDATGTTTAVATLHVLSFKLEYAVKSRSD